MMVRADIVALLDELSSENLRLVHRFMRYMAR